MWTFIFSSLALSAELTLPESLALVEHGNIEVQIARLEAEKANMEKLLALSKLLPMVEGTTSWLDYGEPLEVNLMGDSAAELDCSPFESLGFEDLCSSLSSPLLLREDRIFDGTYRILYPITNLYSIPQGYRATELLAQASELNVQNTKQRIQLSVIEIYMEALHLQKVIHFAKETQNRLEHHRTNIRAFVDQGFVNPVELTRLENAILEAQIGAEEAQSGYALLCQQLELLVGVSVEPVPLTQKLSDGKKISAQEHADVRSAQLQADAAAAMTKASYGLLLPNVVVYAASTNATGQGALTPTEQQYIGVTLSGQFNWGEKWVQVQKMKKDSQMAQQAVLLQERALVLKQQGAYQAWQSAEKRLLIARKNAELTDELRRQAESTYKQQLLTTAELLDAESEHLQSQLAIAAAESKVIVLQAQYQQTIDQNPFAFSPSTAPSDSQ